MKGLLCGWAEADITPEGTVELAGQYYQRVSQGIHSRLKAVGLALEKGPENAVMITVDLAGIGKNFQSQLQDKVKKEVPGPDPEKIFINAIHTHNAPGLRRTRGWWDPDPGALNEEEYRDLVLDKLTGLVAEAWKNRQAAGIAHSFTFARLGHCRHAMYDNGTSEMYGDTGRPDFIGMESGEDSGVELLFTFNKDRQPTGAVVNVACTAQVMEATYKVSSDYMGEVQNKLKREFGDAFTTLCQVSAAGCQAPRDLTRNYKQDEPDFWHEDGVEVAATRLAEAVKRGYDRAKNSVKYKDIAFSSTVKNIRLPRRKVSPEEFRATEKIVQDLEAKQNVTDAYKAFCAETKKNEAIPGRPGPYDSKLHHFVLIQNARAVLRRYQDQEEHPDYEMALHTIRVGDAAFVTNPFELYLEYGQQIKAKAAARQTFVIQLAGDSGGYLHTERAEGRGAYGSLVINGQCDRKGGRMLVAETLKSIEELFT
jgi:hypothetical protein